ncbi:MAG: PAS domain-containing protein [Candidatus Paceibacterota bacterium]
MGNEKTKKSKTSKTSYDQVGADFFVKFWEESWTYIKTVVDVLREPVIILDDKCNVLAANAAFYHLFQVEPEDTEGKNIYKLGNGQWNIPELRKLLRDILPKNTFFKGFEVEHNFPNIGQRTIILNARHIHSKDKTTSELFPPIIMIAMEDVSEIMSIANQLAQYTNQLERALNTRTQKLETKISILEKKINANRKPRKD